MQNNNAKSFEKTLTNPVKHESLDKLSERLAKRKPKIGRKPWSTQLRPDLKTKFKATCVNRGVNMYDVLEDLIEGWINENKK